MKILEGYLAAIPKIEQERIVSLVNSILKENKLYEFNELKNYSLTVNINNIDLTKKPSDTYNSILSNAYIDINALNLLLNELDNQIFSYDILIESLLKEVNKDIEIIETEINKIKESYYYNEDEIKDEFNNNNLIESSNSSNRSLFQDRDGKIKNPVSLYNKKISLRVQDKKDLIRKYNGKTSAKIEILNYQGLPIETINIPENAIDNSTFTYWDASSLQDDRIELGYKDFKNYGHYIDFVILLPKFSHINEINLSHLSKFNIDICQIYIDNEPILLEPKQIFNKASYTIDGKYGEEVRFVLRQRNYYIEDVTINEKQKDMNDLWNTAYKIKNYNPQNTIRDFDYYYNKYKQETKTIIHNLMAGDIYE